MKSPNLASSHPFPDISGYTLVEQLYWGCRTAVYRAIQIASQRSVVIKVLRREYPSFSELVQFRNQYTIAKNLFVPGIVQPLSLESLGRSYILVMPDDGGISLEQYFQEQVLELTEVLEIALQVASILHDLYNSQVVHKDIKPANILIHPESKQVSLIDFSIASLLPRETQGIQNPNGLEGTLAYLAPEQTGRMNRGIDYRADFYTFGVTLYQLLTGALPFTSDDPLELMHCHIAKRSVPVNQVNPNVPERVAAIVTKLMSKNAEDRYQSALGCKHDLAQCLVQWRAAGKITPFALGQRDLSDRFLIPEKLYGREVEVQALLAAFDRVAEGTSELMLVSGFSGIGKTAVINEVHKPIARQRGYFIKGKFDQFNRNVPLSAFVQALRDLIGQLLSDSDRQLAQWRTQILTAVGENGQVLIEVIPELEQIIGQQPIAPDLSSHAAQNRFNLLLQKFIAVFTTVEHPLVIFLDDLQWADLASLQLLKLLIDKHGYLLILGAYRDNEVSAAHPLLLTLEELKKNQVTVNTIALAPLTFENTNHLVADTLNCALELAYPLTELIDRKTIGNPFFTTQFLKALYNDGQISFNRDHRYWECDIAQVNALALTDDVVEFMALQLQKLPSETQQILKLAACVGNQFDLTTLAIVSEQAQADAAKVLWKALQEGLILPTSQVYKFFQDTQLDSSHSIVSLIYRFSHDRIQQAAYLLIPSDQKQKTHLKIGQLLLQNLSLSNQDGKLLDIVNHLNQGAALITQPQERENLARLNWRAAQKAKFTTAYTAAAEYLQIGMNLLIADSWSHQYKFTLSLHELTAEIAFLRGEFEDAENWIQIVFENTKTLLDRVKTYQIQIQFYQAQSRLTEAVSIGLEILSSLGLHFPKTITPTEIQAEMSVLTNNLADRSIDSLLYLDRMSDDYFLAAMRIFSSMASSAYLSNPNVFALLVTKAANLSIQYGNTPSSTLAYADYGVLLCGMGETTLGYQFGQLALELLNHLNARELKASVLLPVNANIRHWKEPLRNTLSSLLEAYTSGLESGDLEFAALSSHIYCCYLYLAGEELPEVERQMSLHLEAVNQLQQQTFVSFHKVYQQTVLNLTNPFDNPCQLKGENYDEDVMLPLLLKVNRKTEIYYLYFNKLILSYLFYEYASAAENAEIAVQYLDGVRSRAMVPWFYFYDSLIKLAIYPDASLMEQEEILKQITTHQEKMDRWAKGSPANYLHKFHLVAAEKHRVLDSKAEAIDFYDRAIAGAKANGYIQEEALANELAAQFYLRWGKEKIAQDYLINAYYSYIRWGAIAKVQDLEQRYPDLLTPILQPSLAPLSAPEIVSTTTALTTLQTSVLQTSGSGSTSISAPLDLATVLKASQTLSSEIELDKLLATLLHTMLENAGANKGALLMPRDHQWFVEAVAALDQPAQIQSIALSDSPALPHSLIYTVKRSLRPIVVDDATIHPSLATDVYVVQQQPKSLLCTPILHQGSLVAILYLENRITGGAFTSDRVELLNLLCTQAAIALENARLYQQSQTYAKQVEQSQLQIVQSEKMASLGNLVAGVAHEINNPIGFLNGSINHAKDYVQDLLKYIALYHQHHPNPATSVQEYAEDIDLEFLRQDLPKLLNSMKGATDRIKGISTSLRTFSRSDTEYKVRASLNEGIDSALLILKYRLRANEYRPEIEVIQDYREIPAIQCFPGQLNQVFMNILANAIDMFDEMAQTQSFEALKAHRQQITIYTAADTRQVEIKISDNGKGMTEEVRAKVFDHLFTTKGVGKGTGLGLAIARQIVVEKHSGTLKVKSELDQGTEFCIHLPINL